MNGTQRFFAIGFAGLLAWFIGAALNVPIWRTWEMGDRTDITITAMMILWLLTSRAAA